MPFGSLWLPVVVSTVVVWLLSAVLHMALRYHRADYRKLPNEDAVAAALGGDTPPGLYVIPYCVDAAAMKDPAIVERYGRGPVAMIGVLRKGTPQMGKTLVQWLLFCFLVSFTIGYLARHTLTAGANPWMVARIAGTIAFVGYGYGAFQDSIWQAIPWSNSLRHLIDSAAYALATALVFAWLWPA